MFPGNVEHNRRVAAIASRATPPRELAMLTARLRPGGSTPTPVALTGADPVAQEFQEAAELGVAELGLYNYGLLRDRDVRDFVAAVRAAFP